MSNHPQQQGDIENREDMRLEEEEKFTKGWSKYVKSIRSGKSNLLDFLGGGSLKNSCDKRYIEKQI